jgi:hypothetical protein
LSPRIGVPGHNAWARYADLDPEEETLWWFVWRWSSFVASACDGEPSDAEDRPDPDEPPDFPSDPIANGSELPEVVSFPASLESNPVVAAPGLPYDF